MRSLEVPGDPRGVPGGSQGRPQCVPGAWLGLPGASLRLPGACPGDPWDPKGLWGRPRHLRDPFHKDDSVIQFHNIIL